VVAVTFSKFGIAGVKTVAQPLPGGGFVTLVELYDAVVVETWTTPRKLGCSGERNTAEKVPF
jgi:hypothetical protein